MSKTGGSIFEIDENQLDKHWIEQPVLFYEWAMKLATAKKDLAEMEAKKDLVWAEIALEVRKNPGAFGIDKLTEGVIKETIENQERYQQILTKWVMAKNRVDRVQGTVQALDHRKKTLENLVTLHGQNYFSAPREKVPATQRGVKRGKT